MRAAIYNPYLDTLGGGERYTLLFAKVLYELGYQVYVEWNENDILESAKRKFGFDFEFLKTVPSVNRGDGYDLIFWISDGSIPTLRSRKNLLHFQMPFKNVNGRTLLNKMKLFRVNSVICNSMFTKQIIDKEYGIKSMILYPPVDVKNIIPLKKENMILYVGRFSELTQAKRHDVLIEVFKKMITNEKKKWKLVLAGGTEVGMGTNLRRLKGIANGFPVNIEENPSYEKLMKLYGKAKFFWSAAGYDVDEKKEPQKMEHFGMSVVEAMAAGCVPLIYSGGGHKEIITNGVNGFLWHKKSELIQETVELVKDIKRYEKISEKAVLSSNSFSYENFKEKIIELLK